MQYITEIIVALIGLAGIAMPFIANRRQDKRKDGDGLKQAVRSLLYADIERRCLHYMERGFITPTQRKLLIADWEVYHNKLGGNGYLDDLMGLAKALPIKESK